MAAEILAVDLSFGMSLVVALSLGLVLLLAAPVLWAVYLRPPLGVLILAALAPFNGLLLLDIVPAALGGVIPAWKEALVLLIVAGAARQRRFYQNRPQWPRWVAPMIGLFGLAVVSAVVRADVNGIVGLKVGFFYLLVPLALWWVPMNARERDLLVTIIMTVAVVVSLIGIGQQIAGHEFLASLGYEYNVTVRFTGGFLRSFSTFNQPFGFALFAMIGLLVGVPVALEDRTRLRNLAFLSLAPVVLLGLGTAFVRAAFLGLGVGMAWLLLKRYRFLGHAVVGLVVALVLMPGVLDAAVFSSSSLGERSSGWGESLANGIPPFGEGIGAVGSAAELVAESELDQSGATYQPDNYFIKTLIELGPIGLWLFALGVGGAFLYAKAQVDMTSSSPEIEPNDRGLAAGVAACCLAALVAAVVSSYWEIFPIDLYFWMLLGVLPSVSQGSTSTPSPSRQEVAESRPTVAT